MIEVLVVIGLIMVLMSIVLVSLNYAARAGQRTNTQGLFNAIKQGLTQFERDIGYLPPVLDHDRNLRFTFAGNEERLNGPDPGGNINTYRDQMQNWYSITTLAEYLIGYGPANEDGYAGLGIRHPGTDGYWGVANSVAGLGGNPQPGTFAARTAMLSHPQLGQRFRQGQVFTPYIQLRDERLLGAIVGQNADGAPIIALPGDADFDPTAPKVIVDYWGEPIRYYRRPYPAGGPAQSYRPRPLDPDFHVPTLSDFFALRPWTIRRDEDIFATGNVILADATGDTGTTRRLHSASFALFSSGPDRRAVNDRRFDDDEYNLDNMVEVGP